MLKNGTQCLIEFFFYVHKGCLHFLELNSIKVLQHGSNTEVHGMLSLAATMGESIEIFWHIMNDHGVIQKGQGKQIFQSTCIAVVPYRAKYILILQFSK